MKQRNGSCLSGDEDEDELSFSSHNGAIMHHDVSGGGGNSLEFHPISCNKCRTNHKKCDKRLPTCSYCSSRGINCEYDNPRKRGKGSAHYPIEPKKRKIKIQSEWKEIGLPDTNLLVDFYFDILSNGLAILSKQKFTYFVTNCLNQFLQVSTEPLQLELNEFIHSEEEMKGLFVFYSALLTVYYQFHAKLELSVQSSSVCEKEISKYSIDCFNNMYFVASCHTLSFYFLVEGMAQKSNFYSHYVNHFFIISMAEKEMNGYERNFYNANLIVGHFCKNGPPKDFSSFISGLPKLFKLLCGRNIQDVMLPEIWEYLKSAEPNSANYMIFKQLLESVFVLVDQHKRFMISTTDSNNGELTVSKNYLEFESLMNSIIHDGFRLMFYVKVPEFNGELIEEVALRITLQTENELFKLALPAVDIGVRKACEFHLNVCREIEMGHRERRSLIKTSSGKTISFDNYALLEKDLSAVKLLASRFKTIYNIDKELIENCEEFLKRQESQQAHLLCPDIDANLLKQQVQIEWNHQNQDSFLSSLVDFIQLMTQNNNTPVNVNPTPNTNSASDLSEYFSFFQ